MTVPVTFFIATTLRLITAARKLGCAWNKPLGKRFARKSLLALRKLSNLMCSCFYYFLVSRPSLHSFYRRCTLLFFTSFSFVQCYDSVISTSVISWYRKKISFTCWFMENMSKYKFNVPWTMDPLIELLIQETSIDKKIFIQRARTPDILPSIDRMNIQH